MNSWNIFKIQLFCTVDFVKKHIYIYIYISGVGFCAVLVAFYVSFYYNVIIGWSLYFLAMSSTSSSGQLPWVHCNNSWNTDACVEQKDDWETSVNRSDQHNYYLPRMHANGSLLVMDGTTATVSDFNDSSPAAEYFQ